MPTDYRTLIDAETWAYIERTNSFYPPDAVDWPIEKNRAVYDVMARAFHVGRPAGVDVEDKVVAAGDRQVPIRVYRPQRADPAATILYLHGGGYVLGSLDSHDDVCAELSLGTGLETVSVDYRLAPEHLDTAAFDDGMAALRWVSQHFGKPVILVGESAGANLAATLSHNSRGEAFAPAGQVLIYPGLGGDQPKPSLDTHANAPMLTAHEVAFYRTIRTGGKSVSGDTRFEPLGDTDFSRLPPTLIFTAECDPLASDGELYAAAINATGGKARSIEAAGLPHSFLRGRHTVRRAGEIFKQIIAGTAALGRGGLPG